MRSRRRSSLAEAALVAAVIVGAVGCSADGPESTVDGSPDQLFAGPQGSVGQFTVECGFDRFAADDPIVLPNRPGASHLHQFFGAVSVTADSVLDDLLVGPTTCGQRADTASYWTPVLIDDGEPVEPVGVTAYYRAGPGVDPATVRPYPPGLMMVAGDHTAIDPQPVTTVAWSCGSGGTRSSEPPDCGSGSGFRSVTLRLLVTFPDCWNGRDLRSPILPRPTEHLARSEQGRCPSEHPVPIPQLQLAVDWPVPDDVGGLALSSGHIYSGHADFWNGWDQAKLQRETTACINRQLTCNVSG